MQISYRNSIRFIANVTDLADYESIPSVCDLKGKRKKEKEETRAKREKSRTE
jgi:hypothetical protein